MSIHERGTKQRLSVKEAIDQNYRMSEVIKLAQTEQDYFDIARANLDPQGIDGIHPSVCKEELSFDTAYPALAYLAADVAHKIVDTQLEAINYTTEGEGQRLFEFRERFAEIIEKTSPRNRPTS